MTTYPRSISSFSVTRPHERCSSAHPAVLPPSLQVLNLSDNRLSFPMGASPGALQLSGLRALVINDCSLRWQQVGH